MSTVRAPQRTAPSRPIAPRRPPLRVVDPSIDGAPGSAGERPRRSFTGVLGTLLVLCLFVGVFGVVIFQVFLVQTQGQLDTIDSQLATEQARAKQLERQTADLESPDRIVKDARDRLNMIPPPDVGYLQPTPADDQAARYDPAATPPPPVAPPTTKASPTTQTAPTTKATTPTTKATTPTTKKATTPTTKKATSPTTARSTARSTTPTSTTR